jgi:peptide/nickel transport system substrate-binding protein
MKRIVALVVIVMLALLASCAAPTPEIVEIEVTKIVTEIIEETVYVEGTPVVVEMEVTKIVEVVVEVEKVVEVEVEVEKVVTATPEPQPSILRFGIGYADLRTMDPHFASSTCDRALVDMIFNGLLRYKPGDGTVFEPDLAKAIPEAEMVDGKQVWTFELKEGVMVQASDAVPAYELTSEDVVYSFEKAANPDRSAYAGEYGGMTFEAVGDYTVKITLDNPLSPMLFFPKVADYAGGFIIPKQPIEAMGDEEFKTHAVGTGPFVVEKYFPLQKVVLLAHEDYFRGTPLLDGVDFMYVKDSNSREFGLEAGELDAISAVGEDMWLDRVGSLPDVEVDIFGVAEVITLHFDITEEALDDVRVRQALAYAISRPEILAIYSDKVYMKAFSPVPAQFLAGGLTQEEVAAADVEYEVDRDKAMELLAEAGYADGFSMDVFASESSSYLQAYQNLQAQWAEIGVELNLTVVDHSSMHSLIREDANPVVAYMAWRPNADVYLTRFYHSDSIVVTGAKPDTNFSHYTGIDELIEAARTETDADAQIAMWKEAQLQLLEDCVTYSLIAGNQSYARYSWVDYGHELKSSLALYPQVTEKTQILQH